MTTEATGPLATELIWLVIGTALMLPAVILAAVQKLRGRALPSLASLIGPAVAASLPTLLGALLLLGWADKDPEALRLATTSFGALRLGAWATTMPLLVLSALVAAFFAFRESEQRSWGLVAAGGAAACLPAVVVGVAGYLSNDVVFSSLRALAYVAIAVPVALGFIGRRPTASASLLPLVVAVGEASSRGMITLIISLQVKQVEAPLWGEALRQYFEAVTLARWAGAAAVGLASAVALWSALMEARDHRGAALGPLLAVATAIVVTLFADLGPARLAALEVLCLPEGSLP